jgi:hypothetical protein
MKPEIENLKVWISGKITTEYQRALAMREFEQLLSYIEELEQLSQPLVISSVCTCTKFRETQLINGKHICSICNKAIVQTDL